MRSEAAWSAWSWTRYLGNSFKVLIAVSGEGANRFDAISKILPDARMSEASLLTGAALRRYETLKSITQSHPLGQKLSLILAMQNEGDLLYADADVLALNRPLALIDRINRRIPSFNQESQPAAYDWEVVEAGRKLGLIPSERLNSGLLYIPRNSFDPALAERLLEGRPVGAKSWFTEQTVIAFLMKAADAQPLPAEQYVVSNSRMFWWQKDIDYSVIHARHFTGTTRHLLYMKGYPLVLQTLARGL